MRISVNTKLIAALLIAASGHAAAGFVNESTSQNPFEVQRQVKVFGGEETSSLVKGIGRDVPFAEAVQQIVPHAYSTKMIGIERWQQQKISWQGGRPWGEVLSEAMAAIPEVSAEIDSNLRVVTFRPTAEGQQAIKNDTESANTVWQIRSDDKTIKDAIVRWSTMSGWQLIWDIPYEYPVGATATFSGTFEQSLEAVMTALQSSEIQPQVRFYRGNNVVRIITKGTE